MGKLSKAWRHRAFEKIASEVDMSQGLEFTKPRWEPPTQLILGQNEDLCLVDNRGQKD